jgi:hypothetical protein
MRPGVGVRLGRGFPAKMGARTTWPPNGRSARERMASAELTSMASSPARRRISRTRGDLALLLIILVISVAITVAGAATANTPIQSLVVAGAGGVLVLLIIRATFASVSFEGADQMTVRNPFRTHHLTRKDIKAFRMGRYGLNARIALADLKHGRSVPLSAVQGPNPLTRPGNRSAEHRVDELNAWLHEGMEPGSRGLTGAIREDFPSNER